jgi:hypothetical protein
LAGVVEAALPKAIMAVQAVVVREHIELGLRQVNLNKCTQLLSVLGITVEGRIIALLEVG